MKPPEHSRQNSALTALLAGLACLMFLGPFLGILDYRIERFADRLGLPSCLYALLLAIAYLRLRSKTLVSYQIGPIDRALWAVILIAAIVPHVARPDHFTGVDYRLIITLIMIGTGFLLLPVLTSNSLANAEALRKALVFFAGAYAIFVFLLLRFGLHAPPVEGSSNGIFPGFGSIRHLGYIYGPLAAMALIWTLKLFASGKKYLLGLSMAATIAILGLLIWSGSRGAVWSAVAAALIWIACQPERRIMLLLYCTTLIILSAFFSLLFPEPLDKFMGLARIFPFIFEIQYDHDFTSRRVDIWAIAIENIINHPVIGHGFGGFREPLRENFRFPMSQAHNSAIEYAHAIGVIGAAALAVWLIRFWFSCLIHLRRRGTELFGVYFVGLTAILILSLVDGALFYYQPILLTVILIVGLIAQKRAP